MKGGIEPTKVILALLVLAIGAGIALNQGWIQMPEVETGETGTTTQTVAQTPTIVQQVPSQTQQVTPKISQPKPVETLKAVAKNKYTSADVNDNTLEIRFYAPGANVKDPNVQPLDTLVFVNGEASSSSYVVNTETPYDVWVNGSDTYYDEKVEGWRLSYNPDTGKGFLLFDSGTYYAASPVGAFADISNVAEASSCVNTSTGVTDTIYYDLSACGGSFYIQIDIGNANANSELRDVVLCFTDSDGDMDGDEITALTATYVSGSTKVVLPGTLLGYWQDGMGSGGKSCVSVASVLGSSEKARWELTFTVNEDKFSTSEEFEIRVDDMGDYNGKDYPSRSTKASANTLIIGVQA